MESSLTKIVVLDEHFTYTQLLRTVRLEMMYTLVLKLELLKMRFLALALKFFILKDSSATQLHYILV